MKIIVILALVGAAIAAPQGDTDAELIPRRGPSVRLPSVGPGSTVGGTDDDDFGIFRIIPVPRDPSTGGSSFGDILRGVFPDLFTRFPFGGSGFVPFDVDTDNSTTHEIEIVNGTRIETNKTTTRHEGDNGGIFIVHTLTERRLPGVGEVPQEDATQNEVVVGSEVSESEAK